VIEAFHAGAGELISAKQSRSKSSKTWGLSAPFAANGAVNKFANCWRVRGTIFSDSSESSFLYHFAKRNVSAVFTNSKFSEIDEDSAC
jgi:hypothetical protein